MLPIDPTIGKLRHNLKELVKLTSSNTSFLQVFRNDKDTSS